MNISIDADIAIHLYKSSLQDLLFVNFDKVYVHGTVLEHEIKFNATELYPIIKKDIDCELIIVVDHEYLKNRYLLDLFQGYLEDYENLFDDGEWCGIALAATLGQCAFATDDVKMFGPYDTLHRELIEGIIPFSFADLLYIAYNRDKTMDVSDLHKQFNHIVSSSMSEYPPSFSDRLNRSIRRFYKNPSKRDTEWLSKSLQLSKSAFIEKNRKLIHYIKNLPTR